MASQVTPSDDDTPDRRAAVLLPSRRSHSRAARAAPHERLSPHEHI